MVGELRRIGGSVKRVLELMGYTDGRPDLSDGHQYFKCPAMENPGFFILKIYGTEVYAPSPFGTNGTYGTDLFSKVKILKSRGPLWALVVFEGEIVNGNKRS
jgi:hypothetical protein